jgi:hypothetical protein
MYPYGARPSFRPSAAYRPGIRSVSPSVRGNVARRSVTPSLRSSSSLNRQQSRSSGNRIAQTTRPNGQSVAPSSSTRLARQSGLNGRTDHIYQRQPGTFHRDWDRRRAHFFNNHWWAFNGYDWIGLDAGFFPWDYYPYYTYDYYPYDYFVDDSTDVPAAYQGTTQAPPAPDPTVTAAQTALRQLGYYNGPADGLFGPATRDAVARYQTKKNLSVTGSLTSDTLQALGLQPTATTSATAMMK